ncbi:hypothetical protein N7470_004801 [Penicillium chermesinum]|nr:hypothetical protein N7470_004801 [Penicillium chermesinum]
MAVQGRRKHSALGPESKAPSSSPKVAPRKTGRFRRFLLYLILSSGIAYGGSIFLALKSDNFHDFFTEYIPYGEECVLYFEERRGKPVTIPSKSGLSWNVARVEDTGSDASKAGSHTAAKAEEAQTKTEASKPEQRTAAVKKAKEDKANKESSTEPTKTVSLDEPRKPAVDAAGSIGLLQHEEGDEPVVQELVKTFNDIATENLQKIGDKINSIRSEAKNAAEEEIKKAHATFDEAAQELMRRFEETRNMDLAQFREEFETEREKLASAYQEKIKTELSRAQDLAEQRLKNELVEQAIELNRKYIHEVQDLVEREREGRLGKLNELSANIAELENLTTGWGSVIDTNLKTQQLQIAVDAVRTALERAEGPRPFLRELVAVKELAADDPVVDAAIASINPTAYQRGIPSTAMIIERFRRVAGEVRKASSSPEDAGIASHAASMVLSKVMFKKDALADGDDVESILVRTENLLEQGNVDAAAREMNTLQGWAKILSKDWLADVRRVLEVKQALEVSLILP